MTDQSQDVFGGVDTHTDTHHAAVVDHLGRHLADAQFPTTNPGYRALLNWLRSHGTVCAVGVEGTGSYGTQLARVLGAAGLTVFDINRPDRRIRHQQGKSDPIDAYAAAQAVASGRATIIPKTHVGAAEALRLLHTARTSAVKARTQAINQIRSHMVTAPDTLRAQLRGKSSSDLIAACARLRPAADLTDPAAAAKFTLRRLARHYQDLDHEIDDYEAELSTLATQAAPDLMAVYGVGPETAARLLAAVGDNPERLHSEAAFAHLCGAAPIPASSGRRDRHRLNRGGNRSANAALYRIAVVRMQHDRRTRDYVARRTAQGLQKKDIIRCLKRYIAREVYRVLTCTNITEPYLQSAA
ncbi:IS110 family transposase [Streptacidiphilus sp. P02-A3a]|uniref:IS110 family transposase n=1 Tax=Streptacidiphilus sp. P02-A3a TaxID=2704468 RepID=UPI0015FAFC47|nr:IS110 family transposase [Streptacidiphilus sp. P02-A3a]QMU71821.1 IS110 family transposase [Streptacidiphilus sp. P02-A3a]